VLGATRSTDLRRDNRPGAAALFGLVSLAGLAATIAAVIYAITLITTK
jgi:hypothetical protein